MADNIRNPRDNNRGLNSIDNYVIDQFITLQSPEELQRNLNQSKSIISNFFNNDLFAIRSQYTQKIEDLETKALINAENARYELELKNRKEINELLTKSLADQAKGYEQILNDMQKKINNFKPSSSSSSNSSSGIEDSAENVGRNIADAFGRGANSNVGQVTSIGAQLGSNLIKGLTNAISTGLSSYLTSIGGKLDVIGSFTTGNQIASNFRSEFGRYSYGNTLKEQAEVITNAYSDMRDSGIIVDPNILVNMYRELGNLVSLTGTSSARLSSLLNVTTKISESGGKLELDSASSEYLKQYLGEDSWLDINAISKYVQSKYEKIDDVLYEELINASSLNDRLTLQAERMRQSGASEEDIQDFVNKTIEDRFQVFGAFADRTNSNVASTMLDLMNTFTDPNQRIAENFRNNPALAALISELKLDITNLTSENWVNENPEEFIAAVTEIYNRADADTVTRMQQMFGEDVFTASQIASLQSFSGMSKDEISALLREDKDIDYDVEAARNEVYQAQSSGYTNADRLNQQLEIAGFSAVSATYEDQTLGWLALIGNTVLNAFGGTSGGIIGSLIQGSAGGIVGGLLTGKGIAGVGASGGLSGLLGAAAPWIAGAAAVLGTAYLVADTIKENRESSNDAIRDTIGEYLTNYGFTSETDEITGDKSFSLNPVEDTNSNLHEEFSIGSNGELVIDYSELREGETLKSRQDKNAKIITSAAINDKNLSYKKYNSATGKSTTAFGGISQLYDDYVSNSLSYEDFILSAMSGGRDRWLGTVDDSVISKPLRAQALFNTLSGNNQAFALLLGIYNERGYFDKIDSNLFNWDNKARDFVKNFETYFENAQSGLLKTNSGKFEKIPTYDDYLINTFHGMSLGDYNGDELLSLFFLANGLDNIPYDGYPAILHEGEMVIPAKRANFIRALFGKPTVNYSNVPANRSTGYNSFVQSIPEYASGIDYITGDAVDTVFPIFAQRLSKAIQELIGYPIPMVSGYRDIKTQSKLYDLNPNNVAKPGYSIHETGWAADIGMANSRDQFNFDLYPFNKLTNDQLSKYGLWKPFWPGYLKQEAWHTEGIETKGMGRGLTAVTKLIERYGIPGVKTSSITEDIEDYPGSISLANSSSEITEDGIPIEYQHLIPYAYIPRIAETLRRVGYKKSTPSYGYGSYMPSVGVPAVKDNSELDKNIYKPLLEKYANLYSLPLNLLYGIMMTESSGNPNANKDNNRQYKGLMQVNQSKVDALGGGDIFDPETNIKTGANYLKHCYDRLGYWTTATAGYNQGPGLKAFTMIADLYEKGYGYNSPEVYDIFHNYLIGGRPAKMDIYVGRAYKFGGIEPVGAYLAEGGIVTSPTVAMIGEGKHDEAVIPLDHQQDYLGIQTMAINIIDALDIISDRICQRLDTLIYLRKQEGNSEKKIINTQRSVRTEALTNFQYKY